MSNSIGGWRPGPTWQWLCVAAVVQTAVLWSIVAKRQALLRDGKEIALPVVPVDPRDLFRGDYVTLGYELTPIKSMALDGRRSFDGLSKGAIAYVTLHQSVDESWLVRSVSAKFPERVDNGDIVIRGRVAYRWGTAGSSDESIDVRFGIERYFVPEGTGALLETKVRDKAIKALVAVGADGTAGIKGLLIDGQRHEDPPLF